MAALSVQRIGVGIKTGIGERSFNRLRSSEFEATPPASKICRVLYSRAAFTVFVTSTSITASWKPAAASAVDETAPVSTILKRAVLTPLKLKSRVPLSHALGSSIIVSAERAARSMAGPPG